ncbi:MAG: ammonia-forming cytochrome c nitrite reductase subunit c552 [Longimicrobiales bacterium]
MTSRVVGVLACILLFGCGKDDSQVAESQSVRVAEAASVLPEDFVGADACQSCHQDQYDQWTRSTHGRAGGPANAETVIPAFDGSPITFADGTVIPRVTADGNYQFVVQQNDFPEQVISVDGVIGGGHLLGGGTQGFVTELPDGTVRFLAFDYSRQEGGWFCNTGSRLDQGWVLIRPNMRLADCGDFPPVRVLGTIPRFANCQSCHGSQIQASLEVGTGVRTEWESLSVNCETCHGPAREHVDWAESGAAGAEIGLVSRVVDGVDESLSVCFQCHALKDVVKEGYLSGESLTDYYALKLPVLGDDPYFPDGRVRTFAYQGTHLSSSCYLDGAMTCVSCHEPHGQGYWDTNRAPLPSELDDGQCTSCHASKKAEPTAHTFHPAAAEVTCVSCHMPYIQHPEVGTEIPFARSDHTIPVPRPEFDARLGLASACLGCHADRSELQLQAQTEAWWGELKPHDPVVSGLLQATDAMGQIQAADLLLQPDVNHPLAQFQALARFVTTWGAGRGPLEPAVIRKLERLAASEDIDVKSLALATLHYAQAPVVPAFASPANQPEAVRNRWAMILSHLADEAGAAGDGARAAQVYQKALAVLPEDARLLRSLGLLYNQTGDVPAAIDAFTKSLTADPNQPLSYVNLGIALAASGDAGGAIRSYQSALVADPNEALAYFNLGNVHLRGGNVPEAIAAYERATLLDPGLGQGYFNLALAHLQLQQIAEALPHARRAVEFSPEDDRARQLLGELERAVGGGGE